jgi:D-alanyl-lipoteichoic acid acyltransferase DltB (MBOAT superfamily)
VLFPTVSFAVFFAIVLTLSWLLMPHRTPWRLFITAASWFFYGCAGWGFVPLLAVSTVVNHFMAFKIDRSEGQARRWWCIAAVTINLSALGWFKYIGFLSTSGTSVLNYMNLGIHLPLPKVLLPAGISFFTFQAISYVVDVKRRKLHPVGLLDFAVYLSFFPHLLAGPIVRAKEFLPQIRRPLDPRRVDAGLALWLIARGLFKKVVIASYLATHAVDPLFGVPAQHSGVEALFGVYAYAIQIYADFSGYTDIAIGLALLLGVRFPENFNSPYRALSLQDFWRRWHMTLSRFLRDYLYIPLGGNRRGNGRTYINLMITMLLGGLWHGASWTFVAWGGLHGAGLAFERARARFKSRALVTSVTSTGSADPALVGGPALVADPASEGESVAERATGNGSAKVAGNGSVRVAGNGAVAVEATPPTTGVVVDRRPRWQAGRVLAWAATFNFVCLGWIFFRATSFANAMDVLHRIFTIGPHVHLNSMVVCIVVAAMAVQWFPARLSERLHKAFSTWSIYAQAIALAAVLVVIDAFGPAGVAPFIYYRF